ncbi:AAA family ATPase [Hymenobacter metallicola]|uniref:Uncharacterized protein n=1 Tax=Hymenobacter metallicola TaxID=2563114 RepID=A0A4Z0Q0H6_9BACT|nr:AAA family ATPase [Hymenobacter metallicola]TGE22663.1 hypothetical protein E5K02_23305 [Hymenobacter metallicola]
MRKLSPYLMVRRLAVYSGSQVAYEAEFHTGVNIIRGKNSSGKSTVMSLLFYGLGGDYARWTPEVLRCTNVYVELEVNGAVLSLNREIHGGAAQPVNLYWGPLADGLASTVSWTQYPLRRSESKESFSQVMFRALLFPEVKTEDESNITIHQVLRLLFIDQLSQPFSLMIDEKFDSPLTRRATGDLLLGVFDNELYNAQLLLRKVKKDLEAQTSQYKSLVAILQAAEQFSSLAEIKNHIAVMQGDVEKLNAQIQASSPLQVRKQADTQLADLMKGVTASRTALSTAIQNLEKLTFDIADSKDFIETLQHRIQALTESIETRKILGQLPISQCPHCLTSLARERAENHCVLCAQPLPPEAEQTQAMRMRQELEFQLRESEKLLTGKINMSMKLQAALPEMKTIARQQQRTYDKFLDTAQSTRDEKVDQMLIEKGKLEKEIQFLQRQLAAMDVLDEHRRRMVELEVQVKELNEVIELRLKAQGKNSQTAYNSISQYARHLLKEDGAYEEAFADAKQVTIDFNRNTFYVDGRQNFSASSVVYLKNSVLYAIFFASLENDFFRYPRLIMCDNMEDKGMQEARSQNLQRTIIELSNQAKVEHQIIFSTSMIDASLDIDAYCIGDFHSKENKTLKV